MPEGIVRFPGIVVPKLIPFGNKPLYHEKKGKELNVREDTDIDDIQDRLLY